MKIEETWEAIGKEKNSTSRKEFDEALKHPTETVIKKINNRLLAKIGFTVLFTPMYLAAAIYVREAWLPLSLFVLIFLIHLVALWFFVKQYRRGKRLKSDEASTLNYLKQYRGMITSTIRIEELGGLVTYPFAGASGFFLALFADGDLDEAMTEYELWIILFVVLAIITPLSHKLAKWMNKKTFGKYLGVLNQRIDQLSED
jgi:hypothetical protein